MGSTVLGKDPAVIPGASCREGRRLDRAVEGRQEQTKSFRRAVAKG
jgi:hypothetical protein